MPDLGGVTFRAARGDDFAPLAAVVDDWWGGRPLRGLLQRLFFDHFADPSLVAEADGAVVGFLLGFVSSARPGEPYVHMVVKRLDRA